MAIHLIGTVPAQALDATFDLGTGELPSETPVSLIRGFDGRRGDAFVVADVAALIAMTGNDHDPRHRYVRVPTRFLFGDSDQDAAEIDRVAANWSERDDRPRNRYLTASEVDSVPWTLPGLLGGFDFDPALYDGVEVAACCTWADETGETSTERVDSMARGFEAPVTMWAVYLHLIPTAEAGGVECVADLSSEGAALALAAALCSQYGYDPGAGSAVEAMQIASGAPRYVIEPNRDTFKGQPEGKDGETCHTSCSEAEAETFAVWHYPAGGQRGEDSSLASDHPTRAEAVAYINRSRSGLL